MLNKDKYFKQWAPWKLQNQNHFHSPRKNNTCIFIIGGHIGLFPRAWRPCLVDIHIYTQFYPWKIWAHTETWHLLRLVMLTRDNLDFLNSLENQLFGLVARFTFALLPKNTHNRQCLVILQAIYWATNFQSARNIWGETCKDVQETACASVFNTKWGWKNRPFNPTSCCWYTISSKKLSSNSKPGSLLQLFRFSPFCFQLLWNCSYYLAPC